MLYKRNNQEQLCWKWFFLSFTKNKHFYNTGFSTISKDKSLRVFDTASGNVRHRMLKAHDDPIYSHLVIDENLIATGDDEGCLKVNDAFSKVE